MLRGRQAKGEEREREGQKDAGNNWGKKLGIIYLPEHASVGLLEMVHVEQE